MASDERGFAEKVTMWLHGGDEGPEVWYISPDGPIFDVHIHLQVDDRSELVHLPILAPAKEVKRVEDVQEVLNHLLVNAAGDIAKAAGARPMYGAVVYSLTNFRALSGTRGVAFAFIDIAGQHWCRQKNGSLVKIEDVSKLEIERLPTIRLDPQGFKQHGDEIEGHS
jgi:hypothetical protein